MLRGLSLPSESNVIWPRLTWRGPVDIKVLSLSGAYQMGVPGVSGRGGGLQIFYRRANILNGGELPRKVCPRVGCTTGGLKC